MRERDIDKLGSSDCLRPDGRRSYLLLGDSHAAHLWHGLATAFPEVNFLQATSPACKPFLRPVDASSAVCVRLMDYIFKDYLADNKPDKLIMSGVWNTNDLDELSRTLDWAKAAGIQVAVVGPIVLYDEPLPRLLAISLGKNDPGHVDRHRTMSRTFDDMLRRLVAAKGAEYISLYQTLCDDTSCEAYAAPDVPLQFDIAHLTPEGSVLVARRLRQSGALP